MNITPDQNNCSITSHTPVYLKETKTSNGNNAWETTKSSDMYCEPIKTIDFSNDVQKVIETVKGHTGQTIFNTKNLESNIVEYPDHYGAGNGGLQCIEAMLQTFGKEATMEFCKLNSFKYIWRSTHKGKETQDMEKADRYLQYWKVLNELPGNNDNGTFHDYLNK